MLNERICVYDDGVLVGGIEPDGTVPETGKQEETTETTGATAAPDQPSGVLYGDVDCNEKVELLDVITLNKNLLGITKLDDKGGANADVDCSSVVDGTDSLLILKSIVSLVTLPFKG